MKHVTKSALKAKMFEYFREIEDKGGTLVVTDYGKPVLQIQPFRPKHSCSEVFSDLRGKVRIDRAAAVESTEEEWGEER